jgi:hypothetical protein
MARSVSSASAAWAGGDHADALQLAILDESVGGENFTLVLP